MLWDSGYVSEVEYTYGYYHELSPSLMHLACLSAGIATSETSAPNYLELGFGQGLSLNIHAAANEGSFWGTDFNPNHVIQAREMADAAASGVKLFDESFADFAARTDLPEFDVIALHGIWTWISDENRNVVINLIRRKLKVGGIVYNSYNCLPGWAPAIPLRHIMSLHADLAGSEASGILGKVDDAIKFVNGVVDAGAFYFKANTAVAERLKKISEQNRNYVAHEFFNFNWDIMAFSDVARRLEEAKLSFAASAHLTDHVEAINLAEPARKLLTSIKQPILYQSVRDYFVNQQFRRDIFVKGVRRLSPAEVLSRFRKKAFVLTTNPKDIPMKVRGSLGEANLHEKVYRPVIEALADDNMIPKTLDALAGKVDPKIISFSNLAEAILVLTGSGHVNPAQEPSARVSESCARINRYICEEARSAAQLSYLASPVTGAGIRLSRFQQLFLLGVQDGMQSPQTQAEFAWKIIDAQNQRIMKDGKPLQSLEDNMAELMTQASDFATRILPVLRTLGVAN